MKLFKRIYKYLLPYRLAVRQKSGIKYKLRYLHYAKLAKRKGVIHFRIDRVAKDYTNDWFNLSGLSKKDKEWFCQRGISPFKVFWYDITKDNYNNYLSDFVFYNSNNYMNRIFLPLFEHKLNTYLMLAPFVESMPKHFFYKKGNRFMSINDGKSDGSIENVLLLIKEKPIAAKSCFGGHGKGFVKYHFKDGMFWINNEKSTETDIRSSLDSLNDYILTEYVTPHHLFTKICGEEVFPPVIRCVTVYDPNDGAQLTSSVIRLGSKEGGLVTDYHGTIYCGINLDSGELFKPIWRENDTTFIKIAAHPDTNIKIDGIVVPNWTELRKLILRVSSYLPWTPYLVTDIIPTENGFKILEINSHGQVRNCEAHYPFCLNKYQRKVFGI